MLATGEGLTAAPVTALGKIFASVMAFVSIGAVIFSIIFVFGPLVSKLLHLGEKELKKEEKAIKKGIKIIEKEKRLKTKGK